MGLPVDDVFAAIKQAGRELVETGTITSDTQATISQEIMPRDEYIKRLNASFQRQLDALND